MRKRLIIMAYLISTVSAHAASFNCAKVKTQVEKMVCNNPIISQLDDRLGKVYQEDINKASEEQKQRLLTDQRHWLKNSRNACNEETCFKYAYWSRLAELETFFDPHSLLYEKESEKSESIKQVIAASPLYESTLSDPQFCRHIFEELKEMKDIHFVDPIVQVSSFEDPALDTWRQRKHGLPLNMDIGCEPYIDTKGGPYDGTFPDDPNGINGQCMVGFGLPPFKLFELPPLQPSKEKRYVFYSDGGYGPMNQDWRKPAISQIGIFRQINFVHSEGHMTNDVFIQAVGERPNYNSIIEYKHQHYFLMVGAQAGSYWLSIKPIDKHHQVCDWTPVKSNASITKVK